jgi:hypothetical protein
MGKMITATKVAAVIGLAAMAISAQAGTLALNVGATGTDVVGETLPGNIGGSGGQAADESADVNGIIPLALGTGTTVGGIYYYRSINNFGTLPTAITTGAVLASGGGVSISGNTVSITLPSTGFGYLVARWDGPNAGAEVWDIAGVAAGTVIQIPANVEPDSTGTNLVANGSGQYGITSWSLFNATNTPPTATPEATSTIMLLGAALTGLGLARKKITGK